MVTSEDAVITTQKPNKTALVNSKHQLYISKETQCDELQPLNKVHIAKWAFQQQCAGSRLSGERTRTRMQHSFKCGLLVDLFLLSRGIHYSANHSLANVQYTCHDRYYYIHIVGKACSVLQCIALTLGEVFGGGNKKKQKKCN